MQETWKLEKNREVCEKLFFQDNYRLLSWKVRAICVLAALPLPGHYKPLSVPLGSPHLEDFGGVTGLSSCLPSVFPQECWKLSCEFVNQPSRGSD